VNKKEVDCRNIKQSAPVIVALMGRIRLADYGEIVDFLKKSAKRTAVDCSSGRYSYRDKRPYAAGDIRSKRNSA
jgi:hypothetical protein